MCGFVLVLGSGAHAPEAGQIERMAELIAHRGPDDQGQFHEHGIRIAFRRLAILDLASSGHQPMVSADGRHVIVFNGAIYNFIELRAELAALGHAFRSSGDTEVLLTAYRQWGADCLRRLNGMFAFAIYDRHTRKLFAARDRFGIKPLFWFHDERGLVLTSEIKTIRDSGYAELKLNGQSIASFLLDDRLDATEQTFYTGVTRAPAGHYLETDGARTPVWQRYWNIDEAAEALPAPEDPVAQFRELFDDAVRIRMRSDVPVAVLLSGGLDSTSIISSMAAQRRDSGAAAVLGALCYQDPGFDEKPLIAETLRQTGATPWVLESGPEQFWDSLDKHLWHQDEPVHSFTSVVIYELMRLARQRGVRVVLNGQGADEVLGGYPVYFKTHWSELARSHPWAAHREVTAFARQHGVSAARLHLTVARACIARLKQHLPGYTKLAAARRRARAWHDPWVSEEVKRNWRPPEEPRFDTLQDALRWSVERAALPLYLRVEDRNAMAHGIEARLPFLDYRLVALAFRLGSRWKLREGYSKSILRTAMSGRIPEAVRTQVRKFGFPTSSERWFRDNFYGRCRDLVESRAFRESGLWNLAYVKRALEAHRRGVGNFSGRLFDVVQFAAWLRLSKFAFLLYVLPGFA